MSEKINEELDNDVEENNVEWVKNYRLAAYDNLIPLIETMVLLVEKERDSTLNKIEQIKAMLSDHKK